MSLALVAPIAATAAVLLAGWARAAPVRVRHLPRRGAAASRKGAERPRPRPRWARRPRPADRTGVGVTESLPDLITLLQLAVGAGCNIPAAIEVICPTGPPRLRPDLDAARRRLRAGDRAIDTVARLRDRWGPPSHPLTDALVDHLHDGTPLLPALDRAADAARHHRRRLAEIRARRLPVLLLFPLVLCTLPAFGLLTVAPMVASTLDALDVRPLEAEASP